MVVGGIAMIPDEASSDPAKNSFINVIMVTVLCYGWAAEMRIALVDV